MAKRDDPEEKYDYAKLLRRREWRERRDEIIAKTPRCQKCGRSGRPLAVHHTRYDYGRLPWDYPDEALMVVCNGQCHKDADEDREEQERDAKNYKRFGWQWDLGKKEQRPKGKEAGKLIKYEKEFKAWLARDERIPEGWDWNSELYPLWWFWNQFSEEFIAEQQSSASQGWHFDSRPEPK